MSAPPLLEREPHVRPLAAAGAVADCGTGRMVLIEGEAASASRRRCAQAGEGTDGDGGPDRVGARADPGPHLRHGRRTRRDRRPHSVSLAPGLRGSAERRHGLLVLVRVQRPTSSRRGRSVSYTLSRWMEGGERVGEVLCLVRPEVCGRDADSWRTVESVALARTHGPSLNEELANRCRSSASGSQTPSPEVPAAWSPRAASADKALGDPRRTCAPLES
jgi:hypothetical protein